MKIVKEVKMVKEEKILLVLAQLTPRKEGSPPHEGGALLHGGQSPITPQ